MELVNNIWNVQKTCEKFVDRKFGFKYLKVFLYLSFTHLNILIGIHKCFVNTFHKLIKWWSLYMSGQDIWGCLKVVVGCVRQVVFLCRVETTKYYLGGLVSGRYGEVVVL